MIKVAVIGAAGYTGQTLLGLLLRHTDVEVTAITSHTFEGVALASAFPRFARSAPMVFEKADHEALAEKCDTVFLCLPHKESMSVAGAYLAKGKVVIDLSADFRLKKRDVYEKWYGVEHTATDLLLESVYGMPELYKGRITRADLVAVPGCYPTSAILALAPVIGEKWLDKRGIVVNSVSGLTGAGRKANVDYTVSEMEGNFHAYGAPSHRHTPEIEQELSYLASEEVKVTFIPHLLPVARGIYTTVTAQVDPTLTKNSILERYRAFYQDCPFITVTTGFPMMKWTRETNGAFIGVDIDSRTGTIIVTSTIDNLVKGSSGQAIHSFNIRHGLAETAGL